MFVALAVAMMLQVPQVEGPGLIRIPAAEREAVASHFAATCLRTGGRILEQSSTLVRCAGEMRGTARRMGARLLLGRLRSGPEEVMTFNIVQDGTDVMVQIDLTLEGTLMNGDLVVERMARPTTQELRALTGAR